MVKRKKFTVGSDVITDILGGTKSHKLQVVENPWVSRIQVLLLAFTIIFVAFAIKLLILGSDTSFHRTRGGVGNANWDFMRAAIVDRHGELLAVNVPAGHIIVRPNLVRDRDEVVKTIRTVFPNESYDSLLKQITTDSKYVYIKKFTSETNANKIKSARIPGLDVEMTEKRLYPKRNLFAHVVGFVGSDGRGLEGAEKWFDSDLRGKSDPVAISIDSRVQAVMHQELMKSVQKFHANYAMGMLIKSETGEMIAMVSVPDFDPENPLNSPVENRFFKPLQGAYEMGSVFKIFNTALAIETGIGLRREYDVSKPYTIRGKTIRDVPSFKPPRPHISVAEIMLHSSNVGSAQIASDLPDNAQREMMKRLGFMDALETDFVTTAKPVLPRQWGPVERATISFGHGIAITPMHLLTAVNAMVNGGIYVTPTLKKQEQNGVVHGRRVVTPEVSSQIRQIMYLIAEKTTAKKARIAGIDIGGKTGTAEKLVNGKYDSGRVFTVFVGAFPINAPQYTLIIMLDEPKGISETWGFKTAAWNAVPTAGAVMDTVLPLLFNE